jgi:hypothetical protein
MRYVAARGLFAGTGVLVQPYTMGTLYCPNRPDVLLVKPSPMVFSCDAKVPPSVLVGPSDWRVVVKGSSRLRFWIRLDVSHAPKVVEDPRTR